MEESLFGDGGNLIAHCIYFRATLLLLVERPLLLIWKPGGLYTSVNSERVHLEGF